MLARMWGKENLHTPLVGRQISAATIKTVWWFLKKLKMQLLYDPVIALLGIYPKECKKI
jgi:hypothetical protein